MRRSHGIEAPIQAARPAARQRANDEGADVLTDSSTLIAARRNMPRLKLLLRGGAILANPCHALYLTDPTPGAATARRFGGDLASGAVQALMRELGKDRYGEPMYNDALSTARIVGD